ncbi:MAG: histidyl-tRNA synthetase [Gammaproteobacteria bacterium]|jgi:histidyl-tRNA synthetase
MNDLLPSDTPYWHRFEATARRLMATYGFAEIRTPILEKTELFARSIGAVTDIVEKEMYTFEDRNGESVTLRPECTASCVRAGIEHGLFKSGPCRLWYTGPMFRHERPQKGRYRQFFQLGAEIFGIPGAHADAELILLTARFLNELGLDDVQLELNSLGTPSSRAAHKDVLVAYFRDHQEQLDEDSLRRLETNPLRILDTKNPKMQDLVETAPKLSEHLDEESAQHFDELRAILDRTGIAYVLNPRLVRGLDYYTKTVFEWTTQRLGAQGTVCGGGRYDGLVPQIGGPPTPGVGFSMGIERLVELMRDAKEPLAEQAPDAFLAAVGDNSAPAALALSEQLRDALPTLTLLVDAGEGSFRAKMKRANRSGANLALLLGADELASEQITVKTLRRTSEQCTISWGELPAHITSELERAADASPRDATHGG